MGKGVGVMKQVLKLELHRKLGSCSWVCESEAFERERGRNAQVSKRDMEIDVQAYKILQG